MYICMSMYMYIHTELILVQHRFELHRSNYMGIFKNIYTYTVFELLMDFQLHLNSHHLMVINTLTPML